MIFFWMPSLTEKIIHFLKDNNFVSGIENTNLHLQVRNRYPIFMDILLALGLSRRTRKARAVGQLLCYCVYYCVFPKNINKN